MACARATPLLPDMHTHAHVHVQTNRVLVCHLFVCDCWIAGLFVVLCAALRSLVVPIEILS